MLRQFAIDEQENYPAISRATLCHDSTERKYDKEGSPSTESQKYPILLPKTDHVVNLIIPDYHLKLLHAGSQLLQAALRFWILSAPGAIRRVVRRCIPFFRNPPRFTEQIMGDLLESRVCLSSVFQRIGLDFPGSFLIRSSKGR
ncbi:integrase catalytic domain-containing protein, partial [Trichonephila inaurata madagascariensis]